MNFFQSIWHKITRQELIDTLYQEINKNLQTIEELNSQEQEYKNTILEKEKLLKGYADLMAERDEEIEDLISELNTFKPSQEEQTLQSFWDNKYNVGIITYPGRYTPSGVLISAPVNLLITPNDPVIIQDLKDWKLYNTKEDPETLIPKIYKKYFDKYYKYRFDKDSWGKAEMWEYFYEMRELARINKEEKLPYDCDSHAQALVGYYIAAGVPRWRVRVVVGNTSIGAHSTVHAYSMLDNRWHHLNCLEKGSLILSNKGYVPIEELNINDKVLDSNGNFNKINHLEKNIRTEKISILTSGNSDYIGCTPEHKFLTVKRPEHWNRNKLVPEYKYASELNKRDLLLMPIQKEENSVKLDKEFCWLLGHYLGDGNLVHRKRKGKFEIMGIRFIKSIKNKTLIDKINAYCKKYTKNKIKETISGNVSITTIHDVKFAKMIHSYCNYANNKQLNNDLLFMNLEQQKYLLKGFIEADGCFTKHREVNVITIVQSLNHKKLINGILFLLRRLGIIYNISNRWNYKSDFNQTNKIASINIRNINYENFTQGKVTGALVQYQGDYVLTSIKDIKHTYTEEEFYEIEVDKTHTYTVDGIICHNSTYGSTHKTKISNYPKNTDAKNPITNTGTDIIGIYRIWFSFNDVGMWYDKVEDIPKELQVTNVK